LTSQIQIVPSKNYFSTPQHKNETLPMFSVLPTILKHNGVFKYLNYVHRGLYRLKTDIKMNNLINET